MPHRNLRPSLLVVDDDSAVVRLVHRVLKASFAGSLEITLLTDPLAAAEHLQESICDILLSDIDMPDLSGLQLLRLAKERNAWTQVIFMTGNSTWQHVTEAMGNGATDYLLKPVDRHEIERVIGEAISRRQRWRYALRKSPANPSAAAIEG